MSVSIRVVRTSQELDAVYRLRHEVFTSPPWKVPSRPSERIFDYFDAFPNTANIIAESRGHIVGNLRLSLADGMEMPTAPIFDFVPLLPLGARSTACMSLFCVAHSERDNHRLTMGMYLLGFYWALSRQASHVVLLAAPDIAKRLALTGCKVVAPGFARADTGENVLPMLLDTRRANDFFWEYVRRQRIHPYLDSFRRECFEEGEVIISQGDEGHAAYVIVDGLVTVTVGKVGSPEERVLCELGPGEMVGEIALLTSASRTANVIAFTDVDVMVLDKQDFEENLVKNPDHCLRLLRTLGTRLKHTLEHAEK